MNRLYREAWMTLRILFTPMMKLVEKTLWIIAGRSVTTRQRRPTSG